MTTPTLPSASIERAVALRHALHADPEVGLHLPRTVTRVKEALEPLSGVELFETGNASSFAVVIRGGAGPAVLLRADMDALPVAEATGLAWASRNGAMHACGHDLHTAVLVGAAHALHARRHALAGDAVLVFQSGEESLDGARRLIEDGLLDAPGVDYAAGLALHVVSDQPSGSWRTRTGAVTGYGTSIRAVFRGSGGHGATPHLARDPIPALVAALGEIPVALSRATDPHDAVIFTPGSVHAGSRRNIIPDTAEFDATLRTFDRGVRAEAVRLIERVADGCASAHGVDVELSIVEGYPAVRVDPAEHAFATTVLADLGVSVTQAPHPAAMTEDFSRFGDHMPLWFAFLGARPEGPGTVWPNHSSRAVFDDGVIAGAVVFETEWAIRRLALAAGTSVPQPGPHIAQETA